MAKRFPDGIPGLRESHGQEISPEGCEEEEECLIERKHVELAFDAVKPSVSEKERERYRYLCLERKYGTVQK